MSWLGDLSGTAAIAKFLCDAQDKLDTVCRWAYVGIVHCIKSPPVSEDMMSDIKPKRPLRAAATSETALGQTSPTATVPTISPEPAPPPEPTAVATAIVAPAMIAESVEQVEAATADVAQDAWTAFAEAQAALARGFELAALEMTGLTRSGMAATADAAVALLSARTFAEAVEINASLARRGVDSMLEGSAKLSEIGAKAVADASRPILSRVSGVWSGLAAG